MCTHTYRVYILWTHSRKRWSDVGRGDGIRAGLGEQEHTRERLTRGGNGERVRRGLAEEIACFEAPNVAFSSPSII